MSEIYFDNGATTRALPQVREIMDERDYCKEPES